MKVTVHKAPRPHVEALWAIAALFNGEAPRTTVESLTEKYPAAAPRVRELFAPAVAMQEALEQIIDTSDPDLRFLFEPLPACGAPLSALFVRGVDTERVDAAGVLRTFADFFEELEVPFPSEGELLNYIKGQKLPFSAKAALLYAYHHYNDLYDYARTQATRVWAVMERHRAAWQPAVDAAVAFCEAHFLAEDGVERTLREMAIPIKLDGDSDVELWPLLFRPSSLVAAQYDERETIRVFWGVHMAECWTISRGEDLSGERLQEVLKILSDKTKFEILRLLRRESMYGGALAEALGLTAATISYHTSQLTALGLVRIVKDRGRYYYQVDETVLARYITALSDQLL